MLKVGVTGNIGCGKSSFSNILKKHNIPIIDADIKGRDIYENQELLKNIKKEFGDSVINEDGTLNRKSLGKIVFREENKLKKLNELTHPVIKELIKKDLEKYESIGEKLVVVDAALLIECGYQDMLDVIVVITCSENIQIERIKSRDNCAENEAIERIKSQMSQYEKVKYADFVIDNSGTLSKLKIETENVLIKLKEKMEIEK